jgi:hypothetical protein
MSKAAASATLGVPTARRVGHRDPGEGARGVGGDGQVPPPGKGDEARLGGFDVDRGQGAYRVGGEAGLAEHRLDQGGDFAFGHPPAGADAQHQRGRVQHEGVLGRDGAVGDEQPVAGGGKVAHVAGQGGQGPHGVGADRDGLAVEHGPGDLGQPLGVGDGEAQRIEPGYPGRVAARGQDRLRPKHLRHPLGDHVGAAAVAAQQGNRVAPGLVDADHARVVRLAPQQRSDQPDRGARGEEGHDGTRPGPRLGELIARRSGVDRALVRPRRREPLRRAVSGVCRPHQPDHRFTPLMTKTGFVELSRWAPSGSGISRFAWSWTASTS